MIGRFVLVSAWMLNTGLCVDLNSLEASPFYDAIIFGDIAEIINDMDNNMNFQTDKKQNSEYESDEEVESLLSEYQHYLEKAEKQRTKHIEKTKVKNKVPLLRRERFTKINLSKPQNNNKNSNYYTSNIQLPKQVYKHPNNLFEAIQIFPAETLPPFNKMIWNDNKINGFTNYNIPKPQNNEMLSSCFCEENKFPCKCNCKQCLIPLDKNIGTYFDPSKPTIKDNSLITHSNSNANNIGYFNENDDKPDYNLNIRIKLDIQVPKINEMLKKLYNNLFSLNKTKAVENMDMVNETNGSINISTPDLNFPIPLSIFSYGFSKLHKYDLSPIHKISLHKKKKTHTNYQNKKHRSKFLPLHHSKVNSQSIQTTDVYSNDSNNINVLKSIELVLPSNTTRGLEPNSNVNTSEVNFIDYGHILNNNMSTYINISNDDNIVEADTTTLKSFNTSYTRWEQYNATESPQLLRIKREHNLAVIDNHSVPDNNSLKVRGILGVQNEETNKKEDNKQQLSNSDLLYWPIKSGNGSKHILSPVRNVQYNYNENITEYGTTLNASWQKTLSKINWTDIDIAASTFSSLVGKHANGILTFCSEKRCRSVKCAEKVCVQRLCLLEERYNQKGHCGAASNERDSTYLLESSLDVSFDIACELAEALQSQMLGFTYGKTTICINLKCITLVANKKSFTKTKCSKKQLTAEGHCESLKNVKVV